jgi:hypothetical protein
MAQRAADPTERRGLELWRGIDEFVKEADGILLSRLGLSIMRCAPTYSQCPISRLDKAVWSAERASGASVQEQG